MTPDLGPATMGAMSRRTRQRDAIRAAFERLDRPLSPQEVLEAAADEAESLSLATVYRALKSMSEEGEIVTVVVPGESPRYEVAGKEHHHHFHCRECGRVFEMPGCVGNRLDELAPDGFEVQDHELTLIGRCAECAGAA